MLHFILGRAASGKTEYLHKKLGEIVDNGKSNVILIAPEQFTFETDRGILKSLGPVRSNKIEVLSFTRIAERIFDDYSIQHKNIISEQGRLIYMSMALSALEDKLVLYKKHISDQAFTKNMLLVLEELKKSSNGESDFKSAISALPDGILKERIGELALICDTYDALIENSYLDTADVLEKLRQTLSEKHWFKGKTVALDGFTSFNAQVMSIIELIITQAEDVYVTLCADGIDYREGDNDSFAFTRRTALRLKGLAERSCVPVAKPIILNEETTGYKRYTSEELYALDDGLYRTSCDTFEGECENVGIYCASTPQDECDYASRKIRQLMREGYRCRDIAVIYRDAEKYEHSLRYSFKKYSIPSFEDARQPIANQPLVLYLQNALKICSESMSTESIMRLLKTGLTPLSVDEISYLENYIYLWQIGGGEWKTDFSKSPFGFDNASDEEKAKALEKLNEMRKTVIEPLLELRSKLKDKDGLEMTRAVYEYLISTKADKSLKRLAIELEDGGEGDLAAEQEQIWDMLMQALDETAMALKDKYVSPKKYLELFNMSLSVKSLGKIPSAIDEVIVGEADRIRARGIKVVFVLGANSGVFPALNSKGGIISERDRVELLTAGIELFDVNKFKSLEERFIAYNSLCCARDKAFLSYSLMNTKGEKMLKGELVTMTSEILKNVKCVYCEDVTTEERIEGETATFEILASRFKNNDVFGKNLLHYFSNIPKYGGRIEALKRVSGNSDFHFESKTTATELFGEDMYLSASKIDKYETCPFQYFCQYGIKAKPRQRAVIDPREGGNIVHTVLEELMKKYEQLGVENTDAVQRKKDVTLALRAYAEENLGGLDDKDSRFANQFNRIATTLDIILERIVAEFENSSFKPCDFELSIGNGENAKIPAYIVEADDSTRVIITGSVDRVDKMELDGKTYIRVIDYKTGAKELALNDVLNGINIQMFLYLFAIIKNGKEHYGENTVPAGVLYFPAKIVSFDADRLDSEEMLKTAMIKKSRMNGVVLNDTRVIQGMDETGSGLFIPAKIDSKKGVAKDNIISLKQLKALNERIDKIISDMAQALHNGEIPAYPVKTGKQDKTCDYCDYKSVCCHEKTGKFRMYKSQKHEECLKLLSGGDENGENMD